MRIEGVEVPTDDVVWLGHELIVAGHNDAAAVLLSEHGKGAESLTLTPAQRLAMLQVLEETLRRLTKLRLAVLQAEPRGDAV